MVSLLFFLDKRVLLRSFLYLKTLFPLFIFLFFLAVGTSEKQMVSFPALVFGFDGCAGFTSPLFLFGIQPYRDDTRFRNVIVGGFAFY